MITINPQNFKQEIQDSSKPVVIDVFASWCGPCQRMLPFFVELSQELGEKYTFAKLNVDDARSIAQDYKVTAVPTFIFIKNHEVVGKETGYMSKDDLKEKIELLLS